jgi:NTE family protein
MTITGEIWLCLSGGNALGAFHGGAYEALSEAGLEPTAVSGASIGALVGAIIAGNPPELRRERLRRFWKDAEQWPLLPGTKPAKITRGLNTLLTGRAGLFHPQFWNGWFGHSQGPGLHDQTPTRRKLESLVDFDLLNAGSIRFVVTAVDVETGKIEVFDNRRGRIEIDHVMASMAAPVLFPPVTVAERTFVDPGIVCNLPLEPLFEPLPDRPVTCIALDAARPDGPVPDGLDAAFSRAQDILFSGQSRRALAAVHGALAARRSAGGSDAEIRILHIPYRDEAGSEASLKALDFRQDSIEKRWAEGRQAIGAVLAGAALADPSQAA